MPGGQGVAVRSTEGRNRDAASVIKATETKRQRGRPKGSKNKVRSLIPKEMQEAMLAKLLPAVVDNPEHARYLKGVISEGKPIEVVRELDTLILLLSRQMVPALLAETEGEQLPEGIEDPEPDNPIKMPELRKDVTERLKVLLSMIEVKMRHERANDDTSNNTNPVAAIFLNRGLAGDRLRIAFEHQSGDLGRSVDDTEWEADSTREVPMAVSERPLSLPGRGEGSPDRVVNHNLDRDGSSGVYEVEIQR